MRAVCCLVLGLFALSSSRAQASQTTSDHHPGSGEVVGAIVGLAAVAVAGVGITYYVLNKGVAEGCVAEADGKKTLVESNKKGLLAAGRRPISARGRPREAKGPQIWH